MSERNWPSRTRSTCEFFLSIGIDPDVVLEQGINEAGYRRILLDTDGQRYQHNGYTAAELTPWPNGEGDYLSYRRAHDEDNQREYAAEKE